MALAARRSLRERGEAGPLGAQPLPRLLERAEPPRSHRFPCSLFTPRRRGEVSFGLDYHDGPPVFLCCAMGPQEGGAPPHDAPAPPRFRGCANVPVETALLACLKTQDHSIFVSFKVFCFYCICHLDFVLCREPLKI